MGIPEGGGREGLGHLGRGAPALLGRKGSWISRDSRPERREAVSLSLSYIPALKAPFGSPPTCYPLPPPPFS